MILCAIIGLVLNIAGTALAGSALLDDWSAHGRGPLVPPLAKAWTWARVRLLRKGRRVAIGSAAGSITITSSAEAYLRSPVDPDAPVEEQIANLRKEIDHLHTRISHERAVINRAIGDVRTSVATASEETTEAVSKIEEMARGIATGTVRRELVGLVSIGIGATISVLPVLFHWE